MQRAWPLHQGQLSHKYRMIRSLPHLPSGARLAPWPRFNDNKHPSACMPRRARARAMPTPGIWTRWLAARRPGLGRPPVPCGAVLRALESLHRRACAGQLPPDPGGTLLAAHARAFIGGADAARRRLPDARRAAFPVALLRPRHRLQAVGHAADGCGPHPGGHGAGLWLLLFRGAAARAGGRCGARVAGAARHGRLHGRRCFAVRPDAAGGTPHRHRALDRDGPAHRTAVLLRLPARGAE